MRTVHIKRDGAKEEQLQPVCLKQPQKEYQLPILKGSFLFLLVFLFLMIPLIPGNDPTTQLLKFSLLNESVFFFPLEEEPLDLIHTTDGGFVFTLSTDRMILVKTNEFGVVQWSHPLKIDYPFNNPTLIQTIDEGFIFAYSHNENIKLLKMDSNGKMEWNKSYCFRVPPRNWNDIRLVTILQAINGGFVLLVRDEASSLPSENYKQIVLKTDDIGTIQWQKIYENKNGKEYPDITDIFQTSDNGYVLVGLDTHIIITDNHEFPDSTDIWLMKLDEYSNSVWSKSFQLTQGEWIKRCHIIQTTDNDFVITAELDEYAMDYYNLDRSVNSWIIKMKSSGDLEWKIPLLVAAITAPIQTSDNHFVVAGTINTGWETTDYDNYNAHLAKVDYQGNLLWGKIFGTMEKNERVGSLVQTHDQGFALTEYSYNLPNRTNKTSSLIKLSALGEIEWSQRYDIELKDIEWANTLVETSDKGFALAGITTSYGTGPTDMWFVKTDINGIEEYNQTFGGGGDEVANEIIQTNNGDFVLVGSTTSYGNGSSDIWMVKTDSEGSLKWNRTYGTEGKEMGYFVEETMDGGLVVLGISYANDIEPGELLLIKTDAMGVILWQKWYEIPGNFTILDSKTNEFYAIGDHTSYTLYGRSTITRIISFTETNDGGFAICLFNNILKTDSEGVIQWIKKVEIGIDFPLQYPELTDNYTIMSLDRAFSHNRICFKEISDNGFILGLTYENRGWYGGMVNLGYNGILAKIDAKGATQWIKNWNSTNPEDLTTIEAVYTVEDGIISWIWYIDGNYLNISKIGLDGTWYWNKTINNVGVWGMELPLCTFWANTRCFDSILTSTGEYVMTGIKHLFHRDDPDAWLEKRNTNGDFIWKHTYGTTGRSRVINTSITNSLTSTSDQNSGGFELIPLLVGVVILKWWTKQKKGKQFG